MISQNQFSWVYEVNGNSNQIFFILGPCVIENESDLLRSAELCKKLSEKLKFKLIFKGSFDKANRTSLTSFRGVSVRKGLEMLDRVRRDFQMPIATDVHETIQVSSVANVVDVLQIPAFLCRQTDLLLEVGKTGKPVHIKKGQFETAESMVNIVEKIASVGNDKVWLCERGFTFGYNNLVVDYRNFPIMKSLGKPVIFDAAHSVQRPGGLGVSSGGDRSFVASLCAAAVTQSIAGLYIMTHHEPEKAKCCGPVSIRHNNLESLLDYLIDLDAWAKSRPITKLSELLCQNNF